MPTNSDIIRQSYLRTQAVWYLKKWLLVPYSWGGSDFSGMDCSGLIIEVLKSVGILPHEFDDTAQGLYLRFKENIRKPPQMPIMGCLVFWFNNGKAVHVEMTYDDNHVIGASGGGSRVKSISDAIRDDAYVKLRPINYRGNAYKICDPFLDEETP